MIKKTLLSLALLFTVLSVGAKVIDNSFEKVIRTDSAFFDFNGNGRVDDGEARTGNVRVRMTYEDYGAAGNYLCIELVASNDRKAATFHAIYDTIRLEKNGNEYVVKDCEEIVLFSVSEKGCHVWDFPAYRLIHSIKKTEE